MHLRKLLRQGSRVRTVRGQGYGGTGHQGSDAQAARRLHLLTRPYAAIFALAKQLCLSARTCSVSHPGAGADVVARALCIGDMHCNKQRVAGNNRERDLRTNLSMLMQG